MKTCKIMNLESLGYKELNEIRGIITDIINYGYPDGFQEEGIEIDFNCNSGYLYLTNEEGQCCMLNNNSKLEKWYFTPYGGHEGFIGDLINDLNCHWNIKDVEYIRTIVKDTELEPKLIKKIEDIVFLNR